MKIDLFTFLGPNSADYAEYLKYTGEKFLSGEYKINWKCVNSVGCNRMPKGFKVVSSSKKTEHPSMNHGVALNTALKYIESDYVIFLDADIAFLYKGWDEVIVDELNRHHCFGGSFGNWLKKFRNFPSVYFFAFRSNILNEVKLDFTPKLEKKSKTGKIIICKRILTEDESSYFKMPPSKNFIRCDTGWEIPFLIKEKEFSFNSMPSYNMFHKNSKLPFEDEKHKDLCLVHPKHMSEWHYGKELFASHRHASRAFPLNSELGNAWKRKVDLFIKNYKGKNNEITI
ncbi:MAG: glycosyltransferase [Candidatus Thorarchaeota archaeon]